MPSLSSKAVRLLRQKWIDPEKLAQEIVEILKGETEDTTSTTTTSTTSTSASSSTLSGGTDLQEFTIVSPRYEANFLQCTDGSGSTVYLAKPYLLRPTTWTNEVYTLVQTMLGTRLGTLTIEHSALTADENQRQVNIRHQLASNPLDIIETAFTETILPFYKVGDKVYGSRFPAGFSFAGGDGEAIQWLDMNIDGRAWRPDASLQVS